MAKVTFLNPRGKGSAAIAVDVAPGTTLLDAAEACDARVGHACGGNLACSSCHVWVQAGLESLDEVSDKENDIMDRAFDVRAESRLACQAKVGAADLTVELTEESLRTWLDENPDVRKAEAGR
jgi:2Fe-2S ferredoxin